ncbi:GTD-binding domain-containing protein [Hirschfeldia incana]|nr:GTD-binding domain-containing protein [Hirschfeldia incana]
MRCEEVRSWTFPGLVAAFLDLSVAFSLLCASSLVYLTSKLLGVFGLNLPCPCEGMFSNRHKCFQETLVDLPVRKISSVQRSVKSTTPFVSVLYKEEANGGGKKRKGEVEFQKEEVFSTPPCVKEVEDASCFDLLTSQSLKKGSFKVKSKRLSFHRSPYGLKSKKNSPQSPASVMECFEESDPLLVNSRDLEDVSSLRKSVSLCSIGCEESDGGRNKRPERRVSWAGEEGTCTPPLDLTLEQVLEGERASRAALALELEKERNAAATAADEALGMILRLQEEKASIEMEARQYQRMIEEKSAFDAEEMSILKEILLRREREKHFLEKEVDTYRQMFLETEQQPLLPNTPDSKQPPTEESQTPQQTTDSFGFEIFTNHMDNEVNGVDQDSERGKSRSEGVPQEIEEDTSFPEPDSDSHDIDCCVHDVHEVKDEDNKVKLNVPSDHVVRDLKLDRSQSVLGTSYGLPPAFPQGQRIMSPNMRRNSMSAVDYERLKIESEVGLLRGRLRAVQKGREKISFSSKGQSKSQVQRFGDKTSRFWEAKGTGPSDSSSPSSTMVKAMSMSLDLHSA